MHNYKQLFEIASYVTALEKKIDACMQFTTIL